MVGSAEVTLSHQCVGRSGGATVAGSQTEGMASCRELRATLVQVYGSVGQVEVLRAQLNLVRRKKMESLTDLAMEIRQLMVMALTGPMDRTT